MNAKDFSNCFLGLLIFNLLVAPMAYQVLGEPGGLKIVLPFYFFTALIATGGVISFLKSKGGKEDDGLTEDNNQP